MSQGRSYPNSKPFTLCVPISKMDSVSPSFIQKLQNALRAYVDVQADFIATNPYLVSPDSKSMDLGLRISEHETLAQSLNVFE